MGKYNMFSGNIKALFTIFFVFFPIFLAGGTAHTPNGRMMSVKWGMDTRATDRALGGAAGRYGWVRISTDRYGGVGGKNNPAAAEMGSLQTPVCGTAGAYTDARTRTQRIGRIGFIGQAWFDYPRARRRRITAAILRSRGDAGRCRRHPILRSRGDAGRHPPPHFAKPRRCRATPATTPFCEAAAMQGDTRHPILRSRDDAGRRPPPHFAKLRRCGAMPPPPHFAKPFGCGATPKARRREGVY